MSGRIVSVLEILAVVLLIVFTATTAQGILYIVYCSYNIIIIDLSQLILVSAAITYSRHTMIIINLLCHIIATITVN